MQMPADLTNVISGFQGLFNDHGSVPSTLSSAQQLGGGVAGIGNAISSVAGHPAGRIAQPAQTGTVRPTASPIVTSGTQGLVPTVPGANPVASVGSAPLTSTIPSVGTPSAPITGQNFEKNLQEQVGSGLATTITNLLNQEGTGANSAAQAIINANQPNVQAGQANLDERLAAAGISPSSSVSAIENALYSSDVQKNNLAELAQFNLQEQGLEQNLLQSLIPGQEKQHQEGSGWNIFNHVMQGLGTAAGAFVGV